MEKTVFSDLDRSRAAELFQAAGFKSYVLDQVWQWFYEKNSDDPQSWSNIGKKDRLLLDDMFVFAPDQLLEVREAGSRATKLLLRLRDGVRLESVLIRERDHATFCLSSQAGCALGCAFCATGSLGFQRNLSRGEIVDQFRLLQGLLPPGRSSRNLVFMGMGEPLLNLDALISAIETLAGPDGPGLAPRRITVSTVGFVPALRRLEAACPGVKIAVSLNAVDQQSRQRLMPAAARQDLGELLDYLRRPRRSRVTFAYVLLAGVNDDRQSAGKLARLLRGLPCKINLIPFNTVPGLSFCSPEESRVSEFQEILAAAGFTAMVRWSKGRENGAACGQLAGGADWTDRRIDMPRNSCENKQGLLE